MIMLQTLVVIGIEFFFEDYPITEGVEEELEERAKKIVITIFNNRKHYDRK